MTHLRTQSEQGALIIDFDGVSILNQSEIESLAQEFYSLAKQCELVQVIIDLNDVDLISSAMIGVFIQFKMKLQNNGSSLKLCNVKPELLELLVLTKLDKVFDIYPARRDALHAIRNFSD